MESHLSDFHLLIHTMLKVQFTKLPPKKVFYRCYSKFDKKAFLEALRSKIEACKCNYGTFESIFTSLLDEHAPIKTKFLRANNKPHMSKSLRKAIMKRSRLRNVAFKSRLPEDMANYRKQRNLVVKLNKQAKNTFFNNPKTDLTNGAKGFWDVVKPFFSNKGQAVGESIILIKGDEIISNDLDVATMFNKYFSNVTNSLEIQKWNVQFTSHLHDPIIKAIDKFCEHPSIVTIHEKIVTTGFFNFSPVTFADVFHTILNLDSSKKTGGTIPIKVLKLAVKECAHTLTEIFNTSLSLCTFPDELKLADVIPSHKKDDATNVENYRPISLLPSVSKVFEKLVFKQLSRFMEGKLSKFLCGFRKKYSTQHALFNLMQNWQKCLEGRGKIGAVLMDLSKAYDCLPHDLLLA